MDDAGKVGKSEIPLTIAQRAERFVEMVDQLPLEASKRLVDFFIKFLNSPETSSHDRKEVFLILKNTLDPASMHLAVESFNLDIQNLKLDAEERVGVFHLMRLFVHKNSLLDVINLLVAEIVSGAHTIKKRCRLYMSLKEFLTTDMSMLIVNSFVLEIQKEDTTSEQCRELFAICSPYFTHDLLMEFMKAFVKHLVSVSVSPGERKHVFHLVKNYFSEEIPLPLEGFIYDIKMPSATHHDRKEAFIIIEPHMDQGQCCEVVDYFKVDFSTNELLPEERVLLFPLIQKYLVGETLEIAINALLHDLSAHELFVEERLELFSNVRSYLTPDQLNFAIRTFIEDVESPVTKLTRCIDAFKLLETHLAPKEMSQLAEPMLEKMHIRLLTTEERKEGLAAIEKYLVRSRQKENANEALLLGVLDNKLNPSLRVLLYDELKKNLTKEQKDRAITSLFHAHKDPYIPRKQHELFLKICGDDIPKILLQEHTKHPV